MSNPFRDAVDVLQERGWHQGSFANPATGEVCILGAVGVATHGRPEAVNNNAWHFIGAAARSLGWPVNNAYDTGPDVAAWNDMPERSVEDVILVLKHAAEAWEVTS